MTDNTSMLERMAERIEAAFAKQGGGYALDTDWTEVARAALQAIREPSLEMLGHGVDAWNAGGDLVDVWSAMIDAILSEDPTNG